MKILILHGPNLNLLGIREPGVYGSMSLDDINLRLNEYAVGQEVYLKCIQSNHEGVLIDSMQDAHTWADGVVFNPGGYTHTSIAIRDAIVGIGLPVVEVHISNVDAREEFRQRSLVSGVCRGKISGFGWRSYILGLQGLIDIIKDDE